jgi:hypothetical protein
VLVFLKLTASGEHPDVLLEVKFAVSWALDTMHRVSKGINANSLRGGLPGIRFKGIKPGFYGY